MKSLRKILTPSLTAAVLVVQFGVSTPALAAASCPSSDTSKGQVLQGIGTTGGNCSDAGVTSFIAQVVSILSYVVGVAAVIMIIVAGFKYITAGGDSASVKSAKDTLIYALIGVAIAVLAQFLIHFVFNVSVKAANQTSFMTVSRHLA